MTRSLIQELPRGWRALPAKHAASLNPEVLPEGTPQDAELLYVDIAALEGGDASATLSPKELTFGTAPSRARRVLRGGDTILSTVRTYLKAVANFPVAPERLIASTGFAVLRPNGTLHPRYAYWAALSEPFIENVVAHSEGVSYPAINPSVLGSLYLPVPPGEEQERIANFLDEQTARIDALIAEKERLAQALVEQAFSRTYHLVTRGLGSGRMVATHVSWLRELPAHWTAPRIKHVARLESGHTPDKKVEAYWVNCDIPWVSLNDTSRLLEVDYITETTFNINQLGIENSSARILPRGTVFFSRDATIGRCGIAAREMACSQHFIGWVCGDKLLPEYLLHVLRSMTMELDRVTMGATLKTIGMDDVKTLCMPLPPIDEQRLIVAAVVENRARCHELERHTRAFIETLREYRASLISAAVTGQLDINTFKAAA